MVDIPKPSGGTRPLGIPTVGDRIAQMLKASIVERFAGRKLRLTEDKTRIVYCKDGKRKGEYKEITFDFLGYTF